MFHDKKWGEAKMYVDEKKMFQITYPNVKNEQDEKLQRIDFKKCVNQETYLLKQDLDYLFKLISKNIQSWWD